MPQNTYKVTNRRTGETFTFVSDTEPTQAQIKEYSDARAKTKKGEAVERQSQKEDRPFLAQVGDWVAGTQAAYRRAQESIVDPLSKIPGMSTAANLLYAPSEALAPPPMAQEEVEKLPLFMPKGFPGTRGGPPTAVAKPSSTRAGRLAMETLSGIADPSVLARLALSMGLGGPYGAAAQVAVPASFFAEMAMHSPEVVKAAIEDPSFETVGRTAVLGAGLLGTGYGTRTTARGLDYRGRPIAGEPPIKPQNVESIADMQAALPPVPPRQLPAGRPQLQIPERTAEARMHPGGPIVTPPGTPITPPRQIGAGREQRLLPAPVGIQVPRSTLPIPRQITGDVPRTPEGALRARASGLPEQRLIEGRGPAVEAPRTPSGALEAGPSRIQDVLRPPLSLPPGPAGLEIRPPRSLPDSSLALRRSRTSTLLKLREDSIGRQREIIDEVLERRGVKLPEEIKAPSEEIFIKESRPVAEAPITEALEPKLQRPGALRLPPEAPIVETPVTVKRSVDFLSDGTYDVTLPDGTVARIFRDSDTKYWYEDRQIRKGESPTDRYYNLLSTENRKDAIQTLQRQTRQLQIKEAGESVPIKNEWLRDLPDIALKEMRALASKESQRDIDILLADRGKAPVVEAPKKEGRLAGQMAQLAKKLEALKTLKKEGKTKPDIKAMAKWWWEENARQTKRLKTDLDVSRIPEEQRVTWTDLERAFPEVSVPSFLIDYGKEFTTARLKAKPKRKGKTKVPKIAKKVEAPISGPPSTKGVDPYFDLKYKSENMGKKGPRSDAERDAILDRDLLAEMRKKGEIDETTFEQYAGELVELFDSTKAPSEVLARIAKLGEESGLNRNAVRQDLVDNIHPNVPDAQKAANIAIGKAFREGEAGFISLDEMFTRIYKKATGTEGEIIRKAQEDISYFQSDWKKPETTIGFMNRTGLKLRRMIEDAQHFADKIQGQATAYTTAAFEGLSAKEIGQRMAVMKNGERITLNGKIFDKYVDWKGGRFTPKKGVQKIIRMKGSLYDVINYGAKPASLKIAQAAKNFRQMTDFLGREGETSNVSSISREGKYIPFTKKGADFWPRAYTKGFYESLKKDPTNWKRVILDVTVDKGSYVAILKDGKKIPLTSSNLSEYATWRNSKLIPKNETQKITGKGVSVAEVERLFENKKLYSELTTRAQHERTFDHDSTIIDPVEVYAHVHSFSRRIGMAKGLGPEDIRGFKVSEEIRKLMNEGWDYKFAEDTISRLVEREGKRKVPASEKNFYKAVTDTNNARLLITFVINNIAGVTTMSARVGELNVIRGLGAMMGNLEVSRRMALLSGAVKSSKSSAVDPAGLIQRGQSPVGRILGIPMSERFIRTWADQTGRVTVNQLIPYLAKHKIKSGKFIRGKKLLDNLLGKDSLEAIKRGKATEAELARAGWQLAKDSQGLINPATFPLKWQKVADNVIGNVALQYKRMATQGMGSLVTSLKMNPGRTVKTILLTAPIVGEVLGDVGSALTGALTGTLTGEGAIEAAIKDVERRGEALSRSYKPLLQDKLGLSEREADGVARYIENLNRGFALGLIGDFIYSLGFLRGLAGADVVAGGITPIAEFVYDISTGMFDDAENILGNTLEAVAPQRISAGMRRSRSRMKSGTMKSPFPVLPPLPSLPGYPDY
jgi:hypothetical protein